MSSPQEQLHIVCWTCKQQHDCRGRWPSREQGRRLQNTWLDITPSGRQWRYVTFGVVLNGALVTLVLEKFVALGLVTLSLFHDRRDGAGRIGPVRRGSRRLIVSGAVGNWHREICLSRRVRA